MTSEFREEAFFARIQKLLSIYVLFLGLPFMKFAGISVTFFIFLLIVYQFVKYQIKLFKVQSIGDYLLIAMYIVMILSWMFQEESYKNFSIFKEFKTLIQYTYWLAMALFIHTWLHKFDLRLLSRNFLLGFLLLIVYYYQFNGTVVEIPQNGFAFFLVISVPFSLYYVYKKNSVALTTIISLTFFAAAVMSQSRTGTVLVGLEVLFLFMVAKPMIRRVVVFLFLLCVPFIIYLSTAFEDINLAIAEQLEPYNPRAAALIANPDAVNERDKSWLIRKLMVQKGLKIYEEHPYLGVGLGKFKSYWVDLQIESPWLRNSMASYNRRSAHNTYIKVLAESGIIALALLILFELNLLLRGSKELFASSLSPRTFIYVSFASMALYFYVIAAITGAITWFIFGLALTLLDEKDKV